MQNEGEQSENEEKREMGGPGSFSKQIEQGTVVLSNPHEPMTDPLSKVSTPDDMVIPHEHDVLSGRGVNIAHHPGNERFRTLVTTRADYSYCTTYSASEKRAVAEEIIRHIQSLSPPGRFLKKKGNKSEDDEDFRWDILTPRDTLKKTCQALRDCNRTDREGYAIGVVPPVDVMQSAAHRAHSGLTGKQHAAAAVAAKNAAAAAAAVTANPGSNLKSNRKRPNNFPAKDFPEVQSAAKSPKLDNTSIHSNVSIDLSLTNDGNSTGNTPAPPPPVQNIMQPQSSILAPNSATPNNNLSNPGSGNTVPNVTVSALQQQQPPRPLLQNQTISTPNAILQLPAITNAAKGVGGSINTHQMTQPANSTLMLHPNSLIPLVPSSVAPPPTSVKPVNSTSIVQTYKPPQNPSGNPMIQKLSPAPSVTNQNSTTNNTTLHAGNVSNPIPPIAVGPSPVNQTGHVTQGQPVKITGNNVHNVPSNNFALHKNIPTIIPPLGPSNSNNAPTIPQQFAVANNSSQSMASQYINKDPQHSAPQSFSALFNGNGNATSNNGPPSQIMTLPPVQMHNNVNNSNTQGSMPMTSIIPTNNNGPSTVPSSIPNNSVQIINNAPLAPPPPRPMPSIPTTSSSNVASTSPHINTMAVRAPNNNNPPFTQQNQQGLHIAPLSLPNSNNAPYAQSTQHQLGAPTMQPPRPMTQPIHAGNNNISTMPQAVTSMAQQRNMGNTYTSDTMRPPVPLSQQTNLGNKSAAPMSQPAIHIPQPINASKNNHNMAQPTMAMAPPISAGNGPIPTIPQHRIQMTPSIAANNSNSNSSMAQQAISIAPPIPANNTNNSIVQPLIPMAAQHPLSNNNSPMVQPTVPMVSPPHVSNNNPPAVSQPIQMRTQFVANNGHSNNPSMPQIIKMATPIPAGNHTNSPMPQIQMATPIVTGNNNPSSMNRPPMPMTQHIAPNSSNPTMMPPAVSTAPSVAKGNIQVSTIPKPILPAQPTMTASNPNVIPMTQSSTSMTSLAQPNNITASSQHTLNSGSMHQPSATTNPAAQTPTVIAPAAPQPSLSVNINNGSPLVLPPLTNPNSSNNHNNNMPLMRLNNNVPAPAPVIAGPPTTNIPPKPPGPTNSITSQPSNSSDVGYEWNNSSRHKKLKLVDQLLSEPLPPSYPSALEIADNIRAPSSSSNKTSLET